METIKAALCKPGIALDRWILRLGKDSEEAGRFEPWFLPSGAFEQDLESFLACLNLLKLHEAVKARMSEQKKGVRGIKKQQRIEQKEIAKMKAKVEKAAAKAQLKLDRAVEKERIKADAKTAREEAKYAKLHPVDTGDSGHPMDAVDAQASPATGGDTQGLPVCPSVWDVTPGSPKDSGCDVAKEAGGILEEGVVERKPFTVPMEG